MKEQIRSEDRREFERLSVLFSILFLAMMVSPIPLAHFLGIVGIALWAALAAGTFWAAFAVEKKKKQFDIQTYKEIIAFTEGKKLDEIEKSREEGKRPYQKALLSMGAGVLTLVIAILFGLLLK